ncbi:hypothetical protein EDB19DRAFT_1822813 [Suillus lakei]|nr:hypothetical protein EDB19DRAFT_1822813 [Suillus lakei]
MTTQRSGHIIAYLPASVQATRPSHALEAPHIATVPVTHRTSVTTHSVSNAPSLPRLTRYHSQELFDLPEGSKIPRRRARSASPRAIQRPGPDHPSNFLRPKSGQTLRDDLWDSWPDGDYGSSYWHTDVDLECLASLEARALEDSEEAGLAGNQQWGLDAGQHHRRWNVYLNVPNEWVLGRENSESEFEVRKILRGPSFSDNSDATSSDELFKVVAPSLPAEEIAPVKRHPSLPAEEPAPVKRRRASQ